VGRGGSRTRKMESKGTTAINVVKTTGKVGKSA
jgi:hypothetical protein